MAKLSICSGVPDAGGRPAPGSEAAQPRMGGAVRGRTQALWHVALESGLGVVCGREAVLAAVERRVTYGVWRLPPFASNADRRLFAKLRLVREFTQAMPPQLADWVLGPGAAEQVPDWRRREALVAAQVEAHAGPDGGNLAKAKRAWRLLCEHGKRTGLPMPQLLPAGPALVASVVLAEVERARSGSAGSQGGATVGPSAREGFLLLQQLGAPVSAEGPLVEAASAAHVGDAIVRPRKHAGSLPLGIQCQLEHLASLKEWSVNRTLARAFLVTLFAQSIRMNDALNAQAWADGGVIAGRTTCRSKDGLPLELYAPAGGYLSDWAWAADHLAEMSRRRHAIPDFSAGLPSQANTLLPGVLPQRKALPALRDLCGLAPLAMSAAVFDGLGITGHSAHGDAADKVRFMGEACGFSHEDARAAGHWLRDKSAPAAQPTPAGGGWGRPAGAANERGAMANRYTQGTGRRGERQEQLSLRGRINDAVRAALRRFGRPWWELPLDLSSWDILLPGA